MNGWVAFAQLAMQWTGNYLAARLQNTVNAAEKTTGDANVYAQNLTNQTNADAANKVRAANNALSAAKSAFGNLQRSIGNKDRMEAFGSKLNANAQNLVRLQDAITRGGLENGLRASEQLGALHAQAAAAGVGGTTAAMLHKTLELSAARKKTAADINAGYQTYDMIQQRMGLAGDMVRSLDEGQSFAPINYSVNVAPLVQSPMRVGDFAGSATTQAWINTLGSASAMQAMSNIRLGSESGGSTPKATSLDMNDGWNNFSTRSFGDQRIEGLGSGFYGVGGESNGFYSTGSSNASASYQLK